MKPTITIYYYFCQNRMEGGWSCRRVYVDRKEFGRMGRLFLLSGVVEGI
jgi:hypothetical protein